MASDSDDPTDFTPGALNFMLRAAPERGGTLRKIFEDHNIRVRHPMGEPFVPGQPVDASPKVWGPIINWPPIMHTLAWLLAHGGWEAMRDYGAAIATGQELGRDFNGAEIIATLKNLPETERCQEIVDCAVAVSRGEDVTLPAWLPNIPATENTEHDAVRELWLMCQVWMMFHELHHILFDAENEKFENYIQEELACDAGASLWLLGEVNAYCQDSKEDPGKVRGKRAMAILVGLFCIAWLSGPNTSATHPPIRERIKILLDQVGDEKAAYFWHFAVGLIFVLAKKNSEIKFPHQPSMKHITLRLIEHL